MKKTNILLLLMLVFVSSAFSQLTPLKNTNQLNNSSTSESCGFDHMHNILLSSNADYRQRTEDFNNFMKSYNAPKSGATYVVPVVVHVMHKGEAVGTGSNISEVDINQGILQLNERFRKIPGSLGDGNGVDVDIEFALAVRDPNGNCTNGIVRVDMTGNSTYMNFGVRAQTSNGITDAALKATSRWNTLEYYNIYLVSEIDDNECGFGIQGYAYFASAHGQSYDGMVQLGCKFAQSGNTTLTHELGHAMNLYHTFEGDNNGNSCPSNTSCSSQGDRCCDTPPHIRSASNCVTGTNSCDGGSSKELFIHNYMDYSSDACQSEFTADQKARANAAISVTRASYLAANGNMALVPPSTAGVDFSVSSSVVCLGSPVTFYDESTCIPNTYQNGGWPNITFLWTFDDGINTPITSTDQNPTINFAQAGSYDVTLQITNSSGTTSLTKPGFVSVANGVQSSTCQNTSSNTGNFGYTISKVVFNTMSATSSSSTNGGWQDLTCSKNTQVTQGQNYNLEVTVNAGNSGLGLQFRVYIDYNDDGAYTAGELVLSNSITDNTSQTFTTSVNIPLTSTTGQLLRLRAISDGGTLGGGCESPLLVGDVEDYGVYINPSGVPPVADFSGSPTTLCEGNTVSFTDLSTNSPTSWSWTFAGGTPSSSTAQNPTITYNTVGTYQVQLTATNAFGNDVETKVGYITVNGVPSNAGAITGSVSECNNATGVSYSIGAVSGATNYTWTVPTGATIASGQGTTAITVNYGTSSGNVTVTPSNSCGNGGLSSTSVTIAPCGSAPVADFSGSPTTLCEGNTVSFTDLSTNSPTSWSWTFAGGTPSSSTAQNPTITYNTAGTYQVQLTATNAFGNDVETKVGYITVNGVPSNAGAITGSVSECNNATGVSYSIGAVSGATNYTWTVPTGATIASGQGTTAITVNYGTSSGNVTVTPSNSCGNGGLSSTSVTIAPCGSAPVADFSGSPTTLCEGNTVSFTDLSTNSPTSWSWTFAGGTPSSSTAQNPTITYNTAGTYQVQLTATNAFGNDVETKVGYITVNGVPSNAGAITGSVSECNNATGVSYSIGAVSGATNYTWTVPTGATIASGQGTTAITVNYGTSSGNVTVTPSNSCGNGGLSSTSVTIAPCGSAPVADFSGSPTTLCEGNTVSFTDLSTNSPTSWSWTFAGGTPSSSTAQNPTITYNTAGTYQVQLTATNAFGNDVETKVGYITVNGVPSNAGAITGSVSECNNATGVSYSIGAVSGATNYTWTVPTGATIASGQGTTAITVNYGTSSGNVTVTPSNSCGNGGLSSTSVTIAPCGSAPVADFSGSPTTLCEGNTVSFTDLSTNSPTSWSWTFAGGTPSSSTAQNPTITYNTAGTYQVQLTATNAFGNDVETKVGYITVNALPSIVTSSTNETCLKNDGTATASGGGTYLWNDSNAQTTPTATGLSAGTYTVTVTLNGCSSQQNVTVNADNCIPNTEIKPQFCGLVLGDITDEIRAYMVPGASAYEYRLIEQGIGTVLTHTYSLYKLKLAWVPGIKYNTTYSIGVRAKIGNDWGVFSNVCNVTTPIMPTPDVISNVCGNVISSLKELIYVKSVNKATNYEYRLTEKGTSNIYYINNSIWRVQLSWFGSAIKYNTVYELQTRAYVNGDWSQFSPICEITTPNIPLSNVTSGQCGTTISSLSELIYFSPVLKATNYEYRLTEKGTSNIYYINNSIWRVQLSWFGVPLQQNTIYELQARAYVNGDWGSYGVICEITTPASSNRLIFPDDNNLDNDEFQNSFNNIQLIIYPNPSQGEFIYMELKSSEDISELIVTDITGKIVHQQNLQTDDYYSTVRFNEKLNPGFYFVTVISGSQKQTKKLVVK